MIGYLAGFMFIAALGWGALFLLLLSDLVAGAWLEALREPLRLLSGFVVALPLLFAPIALAAPTLYRWDALVDEVTPLGWTLRSAIALFVPALVAIVARRRTARSERSAALQLCVLVPLATLASFDWIMDLTPHFHSTVFGVVVLASGALAALGAATAMTARKTPGVSVDLGTMIFTLTMFWAYVAFVELLVVWIGNVPDEVGFFVARSSGVWPFVGAFLVVAAMLFPMFVLLFRAVKGSPSIVSAVGVFVAAAQVVECAWLVVPSRADAPPAVTLAGFAGAAIASALLVVVLVALSRRDAAHRGVP